MACFQERFSRPEISAFVSAMVVPGTNQVRFSTIQDLDSFLRSRSFTLDWKERWGNGKMLFYFSSALRAGGRGLLVRIKTHGDPPGKPRSSVPHLSVSWVEGGIDFRHELHKYGVSGVPEASSPPPGPPGAKNSWGDRTHPVFPHPLNGADSLREDGGNA